jgi:hypothetical protein
MKQHQQQQWPAEIYDGLGNQTFFRVLVYILNLKKNNQKNNRITLK